MSCATNHILSAPTSMCGSSASHRSRTPSLVESSGGTAPTDPLDIDTASFATVALDIAKGKNFYVELSGNYVNIELKGLKSGRRGTIVLKNDLSATPVSDASPAFEIPSGNPAEWAADSRDPNVVKYVRVTVPDGFNSPVFIGSESSHISQSWGFALNPQEFACIRYYYNGPTASALRPFVELLTTR